MLIQRVRQRDLYRSFSNRVACWDVDTKWYTKPWPADDAVIGYVAHPWLAFLIRPVARFLGHLLD